MSTCLRHDVEIFVYCSANVHANKGGIGFSNRSSVDAVMSGRICVFLGESKITLFGLLKVDAVRSH